MTNARSERRLAALLAADVVGYSGLMAVDEAGTLAALKSLRRAIVDPAFSDYRGRIFKTTGDGLLAEFPSAVDAVTCAMEVQRQLAENNSNAIRAITLRVGINVGDVIADDGDVFGDGVNVAARIEAECEPGGVYISEDAYRHVRGKTSFTFHNLGERVLKNIPRPIGLYAVRKEGDRAPQSVAASLLGAFDAVSKRNRNLLEKPSLAILPFQNMSSDSRNDPFADGLVEDITTALSQIPWLFVIARNSAFTYKGRAVDIRRVGEDLGVRYVMEGSVRKVGRRLRVTCQLIETVTGSHIWAERFEGSASNPFELQDSITSKLSRAIEPAVKQAETRLAQSRPTRIRSRDF